jgi:PAS domain-containing protein
MPVDTPRAAPVPVFGAALDERRQAATELLAPVGHVHWDAQKQVTWVSPEARALLGGLEGDQPQWKDLVRHVRNPSHPEFEALLQEAQSTRTRQVVFDLELLLPDQTARWLRLAALAEYGPAGLSSCVAALQDVTELHRLSKALSDTTSRLDEAQEMADVGYWEWDFDSNRSVFSQESARIFGLAPGQRPDWRGLAGLIPEAQRDSIIEVFEATFRDHLPSLRYDYHSERQGLRRESRWSTPTTATRSGCWAPSRTPPSSRTTAASCIRCRSSTPSPRCPTARCWWSGCSRCWSTPRAKGASSAC